MRVMRNKYVPQSKCRKTSNHMFFRTVLRTMPILAHTIPWMNLLLICKGLSRLLWDYHIREFDVLFCTKVLYKLFLPVSPFCCQIILHAMRKTAYTLDSCHPMHHSRVQLPIFIAPHMSWEFLLSKRGLGKSERCGRCPKLTSLTCQSAWVRQVSWKHPKHLTRVTRAPPPEAGSSDLKVQTSSTAPWVPPQVL